MVKTNHSTLHMIYNVQQSATQGSNDTTHRLSRITAATTIAIAIAMVATIVCHSVCPKLQTISM